MNRLPTKPSRSYSGLYCTNISTQNYIIFDLRNTYSCENEPIRK